MSRLALERIESVDFGVVVAAAATAALELQQQSNQTEREQTRLLDPRHWSLPLRYRQQSSLKRVALDIQREDADETCSFVYLS